MYFRSILLLFCSLSSVSSYVSHHFLFPQFRDYLEQQQPSLGLFELFHRQNVFFKNFEDIEALSKQFPAAQFGINEFSHLTPREFRKELRKSGYSSSRARKKKQYGHQVNHRKPKNPAYVPKKKSEPPASLDYREMGKVTPVKNQKLCGACWAFCTTAAVESQYLIHKNLSLDLSEQQLVSCNYENYGCDGGDVISAYRWIKSHGGLVLESEDPFEAREQACPRLQGQRHGITGYLWAGNTEDDIAAFIAEHGPATVAIDMPDFLQHYTGGVVDLDARGCKKVAEGGHGMLLVGYTPEYWIAKNSWGPSWGERGYIRFVRGKNFCSMTQQVTVPTIA